MSYDFNFRPSFRGRGGNNKVVTTDWIEEEKGIANGIAPLGADSRVAEANLPPLVKGETRVAGVGAATDGDVVIVGSDAYVTRADIGTVFVSGGAPNYENVVGGNIANTAPSSGGGTKVSTLTGAPVLTGQNGNWNTVIGGYDNVVNGHACTVAGFHNTVEINSSHVTINGGSHVEVATGVDYSTVAGGTRHFVTGSNATISGGRDHTAGLSATVSGGSENVASANQSTIGGGYSHNATGDYSTICGGNDNDATGNAATVGGGQNNDATGQGATVPGGRDNVASGAYSTALGRGAAPTFHGEVAHAAGTFAAAGDAQVRNFVVRAQTTDATPKELKLDNTSGSVAIPANSLWQFDVSVVGKRVGSSEYAAYRFTGACKRDATGASTAILGSVVNTFTFETNAAWDVAITATTGGIFTITATGEAAKTVDWVAHVRATQVTC